MKTPNVDAQRHLPALSAAQERRRSGAYKFFSEWVALVEFITASDEAEQGGSVSPLERLAIAMSMQEHKAPLIPLHYTEQLPDGKTRQRRIPAEMRNIVKATETRAGGRGTVVPEIERPERQRFVLWVMGEVHHFDPKYSLAAWHWAKEGTQGAASVAMSVSAPTMERYLEGAIAQVAAAEQWRRLSYLLPGAWAHH